MVPIYLNTGWAGPSTPEVIASVRDALAQEAALGPASPAGLAFADEAEANCRQQVASLLCVKTRNVFITSGTRHSISASLKAIDWREGDIIVTSCFEHSSLRKACEVISSRYGVVLRVVNFAIDASAKNIAAAFEEHMAARPRLIACSHVTYGSGLILPVSAIAHAAHEVGALLLLDGAQSVGHINCDADAGECDFYTVSGQKWLRGPSSTGALYVSDRAMAGLGRSEWMRQAALQAWDSLPRVNAGLVVGLSAAVSDALGAGVNQLADRAISLATLFRSKLDYRTVEIIGRQHEKNGIVSVRSANATAEEMRDKLRTSHDVIVRSISALKCVRFCFAAFNNEGEVDRAAAAVNEIVKN